uniref:Uncharacterized protein n=1 Tax=Ditylum brightwellii TaxID=49249 RepID=A0A6U3Z4S1_9STRA|mmetsp:Transcript_25625/g.38091  ORF Transcript_25625/g.38091 Transcript_25625/m.38091 type:complete len:105 (+) Transcript_25625:72-386(+)
MQQLGKMQHVDNPANYAYDFNWNMCDFFEKCTHKEIHTLSFLETERKMGMQPLHLYPSILKCGVTFETDQNLFFKGGAQRKKNNSIVDKRRDKMPGTLVLFFLA